MEELGLCMPIDLDGKKTKVVGYFLKCTWVGPVMVVATQYMCAVANFLYTDPLDHFQYNADKGMFDTVVVSTELLDFLLTPIENKEIRVMKNFVVFADVTPELVARIKTLGSSVYYYEDIIARGKVSSFVLERIKPDTRLFSVSTSGSTGLPKAAIVCQGCGSRGILLEYGPWQELIGPGTIMWSNSTLGYGTVLTFTMTMICKGGTLTYVSKKTANYFEELRIGDPSFLVLPPMAFNKMYQAIYQAIEGLPSPKKEALKDVIAKKTAYYEATRQYTHPELDKALAPFKANFFGNNLSVIFNVGARLTNKVLNFFRIFTGIKVVNCYGCTESTGFATMASSTDDADCIGVPLPWYQMKIVDFPEKNYTVKDVIDGKKCPRGELWLKGPLFERYLNDPKKTAETLTEDGWYKTGDIVMLRENMTMEIIDRRSQIVKLTCVIFCLAILNQSEFVTLEYIEAIYSASEYVAQLCVYADNSRDFMVGIMVPRADTISRLGKTKGIEGTLPELCSNEEIKKEILADFKKIGDAKKVLYFEHIPGVILVPEPFTQQNGLITATYKLRRQDIAKKYEKEIEEVYKNTEVHWGHQ
eukprot:TRINITY_DN645_c0_g1_i1.p1 TRINITY_DN645_c0_g1~~TRINITY_DN645_c0_g1_i1.p1  ORF type:complete len:587 (+),score=69.08 TRINITY_DN645_c0_g1_i1:1247-3007(+)